MSTVTVQGFVTGAQRDGERRKLVVKLAEAAEGVIEVDVSPLVYEEFSRKFPNGPFTVELKVLFDKQPAT